MTRDNRFLSALTYLEPHSIKSLSGILLGLLLSSSGGVDRIIAMGCTTVNVAGDLTASKLLGETAVSSRT